MPDDEATTETSGERRARSRARLERARTPRRAWVIARSLVRFSVAALVLVSALVGFQRVERFLIRDPRFVLAAPPDDGAASPNLHLEGLHYASRVRVQAIFEPDFGRSLYLLPLDRRRQQLIEKVDWIRDASIIRVWPDQLTVRLTERSPVAFVMLPAREDTEESALIDESGVILPVPSRTRFDLPVLLGIKSNAPREVRQKGVYRMRQFLKAVGPQGGKISEIDVGDRDNLKATVERDGRTVTLVLGDRNYGQRMQNFIRNYAEIQKRLPHADTLDLRLEDRITVVN